ERLVGSGRLLAATVPVPRVLAPGLATQLQFLLRELEFIVGLLGEEHGVDVRLAVPGGLPAPQAVPVAPPDHGLAAQDPLRAAVVEAALGQVDELAGTVRADNADVTGRAPGHRPGEEHPAPVRTPLELAALEEVLGREQRDRTARFPVQH